MKIKILVTGANGYIGRYVVKELLNLGVDVIAIDRAQGDIDSRAQFINADIFSGDIDIFKKLGSPDVCLHLAWRDGFIHNSNSQILNLSKHYEFITNMINGGLKHIAVMGSMHEIGYYEGAIDENTICNPVTLYGIAKDCLRRSLFIELKEKNITLQWLRAFYIYGDDLKNKSIFSKIIEAEKNGAKEFPFTSGKNKYDFIKVEELAHQICLCILQTKIDGIINCCSGKPVSLAEKVESFIRENNFKIKLKYGAFPDRIYDSPAIWGDNTKIKEIIKNYEG